MDYALRYDWSDASIPALHHNRALSRTKRSRTTWKGELLQRALRRQHYFETCGRLAPDGAHGLDQNIAEFQGLIEQVQWEIQGNRQLPLPQQPYREVPGLLPSSLLARSASDGCLWACDGAFRGLGKAGSHPRW